MSRNVTLVNTYYPITYFANNSVNQVIAQDPTNFWASTEQFAPEAETLVFDFGSVRPINFVDFELTSKPIDLLIEYDDGSGNWIPITYTDDFIAETSVQYLPSLTNAWHYSEHHFNFVQTQYIRITFTRRTDSFPLNDSDPFPWSIDVRNARFMYLILQADDFVSDSGTDILGNNFQTDLVTYPAANVLDADITTYWQSQPNPSQFAVEALYFDMRNTAVTGTQAYLEQWEQGNLDSRGQGDVESYLSDGVVIDEIYIDPLTFGPTMHIYYSNDDYPDWDNKLWIPVPRHYILKRGFHALPSPTFLKYIKLEFSNLTPIPYSISEYPKLPPITYRKFPTWVQNYFEGTFLASPDSANFINPIDQVTIDPLALGFTRQKDTLDSGLNTRQTPSIEQPQDEIKDFISALTLTQQQTTSTQQPQQQVEQQIMFNTSWMFQSDLIAQLDDTRALTRLAKQGESSWNSEDTPITEPAPTVQSVTDLSQAIAEKTAPIMYFPYQCRHQYQVLKADRNSKIAFIVGIKEISFHRRDYSVQFDEDYYIETFDDTQNFGGVNDFTEDDWRYIVEP